MKVTSFRSKFLSVCLLFVSLLCLSGSMSEYGAPFTKSSHHWSTKRTSHSTSHCGGGVRLLGGASHRHDRDTRRHWMTSGPPAHHLVWKWVSSLSSAIWRQKKSAGFVEFRFSPSRCWRASRRPWRVIFSEQIKLGLRWEPCSLSQVLILDTHSYTLLARYFSWMPKRGKESFGLLSTHLLCQSTFVHARTRKKC
jgi:hypothetical protein